MKHLTGHLCVGRELLVLTITATVKTLQKAAAITKSLEMVLSSRRDAAKVVKRLTRDKFVKPELHAQINMIIVVN